MSERQRELIHDLRIELEETKAKLASAERRASEAIERIATAAAKDAVAQQAAALRDELAASQGREAAMRAALEKALALIEHGDFSNGVVENGIDEGDVLAAGFVDRIRAALATDGSGWVSPETVSGLVEAARAFRDVARKSVLEVVAHGEVLYKNTARKLDDALAAFENSKRGGHESPTWPIVIAFARRMEAKLEKNRHKGNREGWLKDSTDALFRRLKEESVELITALHGLSPAERIADEAADVANFAMMIADVALDGAKRGGK